MAPNKMQIDATSGGGNHGPRGPGGRAVRPRRIVWCLKPYIAVPWASSKASPRRWSGQQPMGQRHRGWRSELLGGAGGRPRTHSHASQDDRVGRVDDAYPPPASMPLPSASQPAFAADVVTATVVFGLGDRCAKVTLIAPQAPHRPTYSSPANCSLCTAYLHHVSNSDDSSSRAAVIGHGPRSPTPKRLTLPWATCRGRQQLNGRGGTIFFSRMANGPEVTVVDIAIRLRFVGYIKQQGTRAQSPCHALVWRRLFAAWIAGPLLRPLQAQRPSQPATAGVPKRGREAGLHEQRRAIRGSLWSQAQTAVPGGVHWLGASWRCIRSLQCVHNHCSTPASGVMTGSHRNPWAEGET
ncbi:hypothetical protein COCVIDRAFT_12832 [Bipolaris victoriae FI3]|uniref:Uncharacterized protein n=1 Tax=Bipolaris victoriae (strain FI3) TaxID=930091 RepID=W7ESC0_BIPV3|nr:hypothetical protein COCVIDRAFT_12832 [Bipolaris victoriae FI3]